MSTPPKPPPPIEYCPFCRRVMVELAEYCAAENVAGVWGDTAYDRVTVGGLVSGLLGGLLALLGLAGAAVRQRRLDRVLEQYPYSLLCAGCGHVERRRFPPETPGR